MKINIKKLDNCVSLPIRAHATDAGADVFATKQITLEHNERYAMPLGFCLEIPKGYMGIIVTKSSMFKNGIYACIPPVDSGYTGECHALLHNSNKYTIEIEKGDKVGQLIILPIEYPIFNEVTELNVTERGSGAFGSTGSKLNEK